MKIQFRAKPKPFLDPSRRDWQFDAFAWLLRNCGGYPKFLDTTLVLPTEEHFPDRGLSGHAAVTALFRRVRDHAGMADWPCVVEPESQPPRAAPPVSTGIPIITYKSDGLGPMPLVAVFAHGLAELLVETFEERAPGGARLHEPAIDLAAVFMGFGLFLADSAVHGAHHDLNEGELVHALAIFCVLRKLPSAAVERHLNPHLRKYLRLAARDLAQHDLKFQRLRSIFAVFPMDLADRTQPTRAR